MTESLPQPSSSLEFPQYLFSVLNAGALSLMISVGHKTGLFDTLATLPWSTSEKIAAEANLKERYVREWLSTMVVGKIVDHDPNSLTYSLPAERAAFLTRGAGPKNLANMTQYIGLLATVEDKIVEVFREGGGVPYSEYPQFQRIMAEASGRTHDAVLIDAVLPLTGIVQRLHQGIDVADVGCGQGHALNLMAKAFPRSRFTGFDISEVGIAAARAEAEREGLDNVTFEVFDAGDLAFTDHRFDFVTTFDAVHDQAHPDLVLSGIFEVLRPGGTYLCVDIAASSVLCENTDHLLGAFLYTISCMHCMTVSLASDGVGLGAMWGRQQAVQMLQAAGFSSIELKRLDTDIINQYYIATKES